MRNIINRLRPHLRRALDNPDGAINYMYRAARDPIINLLMDQISLCLIRL